MYEKYVLPEPVDSTTKRIKKVCNVSLESKHSIVFKGNLNGIEFWIIEPELLL